MQADVGNTGALLCVKARSVLEIPDFWLTFQLDSPWGHWSSCQLECNLWTFDPFQLNVTFFVSCSIVGMQPAQCLEGVELNKL